MCGIAGIVGSGDHTAMPGMLKSIAHRGPDFSAIYEDQGFCTLGHNRLSIIDLSAAANQPFSDPNGRYTLVFNGEIYNYIELRNQLQSQYEFRTQSDTEVLLAAYMVHGKDLLTKLRGMFAFAIWDAQEKSLFAARDPFGVKPFYFSRTNTDFVFASEIKGLFAAGVPKKLNTSVWANFYASGSYGAPQETFYESIFQLPGGHYLELRGGKLHQSQWYDFVNRVNQIQPVASFQEASVHYEELLKESVALRFRADVPVGFNLSGGVDSSALLAYVNDRPDAQAIEAFTFYTGDERYDELYWVEQMIERTGNPLNKVLLSPEDAEKSAQSMADQQDEPFGGIPTLAYAKIFQAASRKGIKVLLDGQGMDEQWAGYDYYFKQGGQLIQGVTQSGSPFKKEVLSAAMQKLIAPLDPPQPFDNRLQNLQYRDLFYTKIPRALRFNDRVSMASSTELREPFLDHQLVEYAFAQPEAYKRKGVINKFLLRLLIEQKVGSTISYAPKRPLQTPQREWLAGPLKPWVASKIKGLKHSPVEEWFDHEKLQKYWKEYQEGDQQFSFHIWQWLNTALLLEQD
ncbi:asparagine synthase (glutamine-hydrolyzing) [Croceiramulus getboli]|nr:asparagine synthase (glutamine-hydrolyzing) [Flavobacteriaceae bacterium YJPT1-3]